MQNEIWVDIKGYENLYQVSNCGGVRVKARSVNQMTRWGHNATRTLPPRTMRSTDNGYGYLIVQLTKQRKRKSYYVHRLVAEAFIGTIKKGYVINHKDFNKKNNCVTNLEIATQKENVAYSVVNMSKPRSNTKPKSGEKHIRLCGSKFEVGVKTKDKYYYIGRFETIEEAKVARNKLYEEINYYK